MKEANKVLPSNLWCSWANGLPEAEDFRDFLLR